MKSIREATAITLTNEERTELEGLARSTKTEHRLRQRARIVLLSADGLATRAVGRAVGCTTGTASKWRGRPPGGRVWGLRGTRARGQPPQKNQPADHTTLPAAPPPTPPPPSPPSSP